MTDARTGLLVLHMKFINISETTPLGSMSAYNRERRRGWRKLFFVLQHAVKYLIKKTELFDVFFVYFCLINREEQFSGVYAVSTL